MAYFVKKSAVVLVAGVSLSMMLSACSTDQHYKREINGNEDYLETAPLKELKTPNGVILPVQNMTYAVSQRSAGGAVGKALDIRPPSQALAQVNGSRTRFENGAAVALLEGSSASSDVWNKVIRAAQSNNYKIVSRQDSEKILNTDWIQFQRADEDSQYQGRYQISVQPQGYQTAVVVKSIELRQGEKIISNTAEVQRYTVSVLNAITGKMNKN